MFDLIIIGGGPTGIYGCFYACLNNLTTHIIEIDKNLGGAPAKMYPEKSIYDIPGFVSITGNDFVLSLIKQLETKQKWSISTNTLINEINKLEDGTFLVCCSNNQQFKAKNIIVTTGYGAFKFKNVNENLIDSSFNISKIHHSIKHLNYYKNKKLIICGGGNSALDYTNILSKYAKSITLIHHSEKFSGMKNTLEIIQNLENVSIIKNCEIVRIESENIRLKTIDNELQQKFDDILVFYGVEQINNCFNNLSFFNESKKIEVNEKFESIKLPGLYACGKCNNIEMNNLMIHGFSQICQVIDTIIHNNIDKNNSKY